MGCQNSKLSQNKQIVYLVQKEQQQNTNGEFEFNCPINIWLENKNQQNCQYELKQIYQRLDSNNEYKFSCGCHTQDTNNQVLTMKYESKLAKGITLVAINLKNGQNILKEKKAKVLDSQGKYLSTKLIDINNERHILIGIGRGYCSFVNDLAPNGNIPSFDSLQTFLSTCLQLSISLASFSFNMYENSVQNYYKENLCNKQDDFFVENKLSASGYTVVYDISKLQNLCQSGLKIIRGADYSQEQKISGRVTFYGRENRGKTFMIKQIFNLLSLADGFNVHTQGLSMIHIPKNSGQYIGLIDMKGSTSSCDRSDKDIHKFFSKNLTESRQHFIMQKTYEKSTNQCVLDMSNVIILVVSSISDEEQQLMMELISQHQDQNQKVQGRESKVQEFMIIHNYFHITNLDILKQEIQKNIDLYDLKHFEIDKNKQNWSEKNQSKDDTFQKYIQNCGENLNVKHYFMGHNSTTRMEEWNKKCFKQIKDFLENYVFQGPQSTTDELVRKSLERSLNKNLNFYTIDDKGERKYIDSITLKIENDFIKVDKIENIKFEVAHNQILEGSFNCSNNNEEVTARYQNLKLMSVENIFQFDLPGYTQQQIRENSEVKAKQGVIQISFKSKPNNDTNPTIEKTEDDNQQKDGFDKVHPHDSQDVNNIAKKQPSSHNQSCNFEKPKFDELHKYYYELQIPKLSLFSKQASEFSYHTSEINKYIRQKKGKIWTVKGGVAQLKIKLFWH